MDFEKTRETIKYWIEQDDCVCSSNAPIGACARCDMTNILKAFEELEKENKAWKKAAVTVAKDPIELEDYLFCHTPLD